ncbi:MAG TPA: hypothetical protein VGS10_15255 [Terracidiphilus sp.]|nr:hypothetical protein [Terracidiphilus sp.]
MKYQSALSLPALAACLVLLGPNFAAARTAANTTAQTSIAGQHEAMKMVPARADLTRTLNASNVRAGQQFEAKLSNKVDLKNGPVLPKGTELVGKVVKDQSNPSSLTLRFTKAELKNGTAVPIKATIVGLYSAQNQYGESYGMNQMPNYWTPQTLQVDQINALHHIDLHSRIAASNSGVLQSKKNIRFSQGTEFALAIAKRS